MRTLTALALVLATTSFAYASGINETSVMQINIGKGNTGAINQKSGFFSYNKASLTQIGSNTAAIGQEGGFFNTNNAFVFQAGKGNLALVRQTGGTNNAAAIQVGIHNTALISQVANPFGIGFHKNTNNAFVGQWGSNNFAWDNQNSWSGAQNSANTIQVGTDNTAVTIQYGGHGTYNSQNTTQFGHGGFVGIVQH